MTITRRQECRGDKPRASRSAPPQDLLTLDAETIAARIEDPPTLKADRIVAALTQLRLTRRVPRFDPKGRTSPEARFSAPAVVGGRGVHNALA
jgi:hypothetical protein